MSKIHTHRIRVCYGDTDFTGVVYYANYLRFFEQARSEAMDAERLRRDFEELGAGLVVYKADITFLKPARYGDQLEVRTRGYTEGDYRLMYDQTIHRVEQGQALEATLVKVIIQAAQVDRNGNLIALRQWIKDTANALG